MKQNKLLAFVLLASGVCASHMSYAAANGVINMKGLITSSTCSIDVNGASNATLELPPTPSNLFTSSTPTRGDVPFTINLTQCNDVAENALNVVLTKSDGKADAMIPATGGTAQNVGFRLRYTDGKVVDWKSPTGGTETIPVTLSNGQGKVDLVSQYYAQVFPVKAGTVTAAITMAISYR